VRSRLLLFGGLDPSGGAGLTVDVAVADACGAEGLPVAVALTVQNRRGFANWSPVATAQWRAAAAAQLDDAAVDVIKVGFVGDAQAVRDLAAFVRERAPAAPLVVDPVLGATAGGLAASPDLLDAYRTALLPLATVCTPNLPELQQLFGGDPAAALATGCRAVLCKGGHGSGPTSVDVLVQAGGEHRWERPRRDVGAVRGTGCRLATAIAAHLAGGLDLAAACARAGDELAGALAALGPPPADGLPRGLSLRDWPRT